MAKREQSKSGRVWALRAGIAVMLGVPIGFGMGALAVRVMQPAGVPASDSIATDSLRRSRKNASAAIAAEDKIAVDDSALRAEHRVAGTLVPRLIGMEEGDARNAIAKAGFTIGTVLFKSSGESAGTVLETFPVPGESVQLPATINLILSDGHHRKDTANTPPQFDDNFFDSPNTQ